MKKILLLCILLCSGCGNKLTCTYKYQYDDIKIDNKIVFNFKSKNYSEKDIMVFNSDEEAKDYFNDILDYVDEYNLKLVNNKIISELSGDIDQSRKDLKEKYESYDFKCK